MSEATTADQIVYECPNCHREGPWTNGTSVAAGDEVDEFWCQTCGTETPLVALLPGRSARAAALFESYVPGWPRDAWTTSSLRELIASVIDETTIDPNNGSVGDQCSDAIIAELGIDDPWVAIRTTDDPLFGAYKWAACPKCGHVDEDPERTS